MTSINQGHFRNSRWDLIDPIIEAQNARLPEGWYWECGGTCARLYSPSVHKDVEEPTLRAWAYGEGTWLAHPPDYASGLGVDPYFGETQDFNAALEHVTDMALDYVLVLIMVMVAQVDPA